jgi:hypothetical protein
LFDRARQDNAYAVHGVLSYRARNRDVTIDRVKITLRGHTSRRETECSFPKLKLHFPPGAALDASIFARLDGLKIGTHCGESTDEEVTPRFGRLPSERSPHREAFVYRLLDIVGVLSPRARPARIAYVYTDGRERRTPDQPDERQPIVRNAMLLEDTTDVLARLGAAREVAIESFTNAAEMFATADAAALALAEAMIGNFDWCLKFSPADAYRCDARRRLWNIAALAWPDGTFRPLIYDFDVAGMVAGYHRWFGDVFNEAFVSSRSHPQIEVISQVQRTRTLFTRATASATLIHQFTNSPTHQFTNSPILTILPLALPTL